MNRALRIFVCLGCVLLSDAPELRAQSNIEVDGLGLLGDRRMDQRLSFLLGTDNKTAVELDSAFLEDSAFLLLEQMRRGGYLRPSVKAIFSGASAQVEAEWGTPYAVQLPVEFRADSAIFRLQRGPLFFYKSVEVSGLEEIEIGTLKRFFVPGGSLIKRKKDLAYTPENFERRKNRLLAALKALGYAEAEVFSEEVDMDETTGAVRVRLEVKAGPVYRVGPVTLKVIEGEAEWFQPIHFAEGGIFNPEWLREARATLRNAAYGAGRPDVEVSSHLGEPLPDAEGMLQPAVFKLRPGPEIYLEGLRFEGDPETKESVLRRQADLEAGALLDPRETDRARRRLMALGIFRQVELDYDTQSYGSRVAVYRLTPGTRQELQLLAGWGSYEQARVGFLWTHHNPWGRAHRYTLSAKQSVKATRLATNYQIEQLFGSDLTGYSEAEFGSRKEIGYERSRQGGLVGVSKLLGETGIRLALEYGWFIEQTDGIDETAVAGDEDAQVASLTLTASLDRRDSVLAPTSGYTLFAAIKTANQALGGSVDFQKFEIGGSYHFSVSESTLLHLGLKGGVLIGSSNELPFNERFFPGGENSVRGFQQGEATALDIDGDPIGAESFWVANLEVEQRLLSDVSVVAFFDAVGFHRENGQGGESETLATAGLGLRYQTIVGPLRLEYGHNINPREQDPSGTLHFSIGFPF